MRKNYTRPAVQSMAVHTEGLLASMSMKTSDGKYSGSDLYGGEGSKDQELDANTNGFGWEDDEE